MAAPQTAGRPWRVAGAPVSFGVDEILQDDAWMPGPLEVLDWLVEIGFDGTELGPPGYLGTGSEVRERLASRRLELVGAFLPQHFSRDEQAGEDRRWLLDQLTVLADAAPPGSRPLAILSDGFDEPERVAFAGRIGSHPEAALSLDRFETLIANIHRAAELCRSRGFEVALHPHAGTYVESADEIARVAARLDRDLLGLVLDTGHFRFGGADPVRSVADYRDLIRHVHLKDCSATVIEQADVDGADLPTLLARGVFPELGRGDVDVAGVLEALGSTGYEGWLVIEQDQALGPADTRASLVAGQRRNRAFLRRLGA